MFLEYLCPIDILGFDLNTGKKAKPWVVECLDYFQNHPFGCVNLTVKW